MRGAAYVKVECPLLYERMMQDEQEGLFDWDWSIRSDESMDYLSRVLGRRIERSEIIPNTLREIEDKLKAETVPL